MANKEERIMYSKKCVVIGIASLTLECIKYLHSNEYSISVITTSSQIKNWCHSHRIQTFESVSQYDLLDHTDQQNTILFSIANYQILKERFTSRFLLAINYHDSLLPKYAGVYATTWALLNNETTHGISWHVIEPEIDTGNIILSRAFGIDPKETAFSLNVKCTNEALASFPLLLEKIEEYFQTISPSEHVGKGALFVGEKQDFSKRTLYLKDSPLSAHALISFDDSIQDIDKVLRAFYFHKEIFNPLSFPKICINHQSFLLEKVEIKNRQYPFAPGHIIEKDAKQIEIAVKDGSIVIKKIMNNYGKELTISDFLERSKLYPNRPETFSLSEYQQAKKSEGLWHKELIKFNYPNLIEPCKLENSYSIQLKSENKFFEDFIELMLMNKFSILYTNENLLNFSNKSNELYSPFIPITIQNSEKPFSPASSAPLLADLFARSQFNKEDFPILIFSENCDVLDKIPFDSFVLITLTQREINIFERKAKLKKSAFFRKDVVSLVQAGGTNKGTSPKLKPALKKPNLFNISELIYNSNLNKSDNFIFEANTWYNFDSICKKASQLSHYLVDLGIKKNEMVGIGIPTGVDYFISLLAVSNLGATYVPLDPDYPTDRLLHVVKDTRLGQIITVKKYSPKFGFPSVIVSELDTVQCTLDHYSKLPPHIETESDTPLNVIYTSGTTGVPKGVVVSHANVRNCLMGTLELVNLKGKSFLAVTSTSFDIHLLDYLLPLCSGGKLVVAPQEAIRNGKFLLQLIQEHNVTAMQATPMTYRMLIESGWRGSKEFIITCCGEPLPSDLAQQLLERGTLYNLYGPTEATIYASGTLVDDPNSITIGKEIGETQIHILNENNEPIGLGEEGQIAIGGKGVAIEYLNLPQLTCEKFISLPSNPDQRVYLTGDIGKRLEDGNILYIGRKDDQVKINGFRIEIKEIEEVLKQATPFKNIIVLSNQKNQNSKKIIVYLESCDLSLSESSLIAKLKEYAEKKLPKFMLPHQYHFIEKFPLMLSGKVDRKKLAEIELKNLPTIDYQSDTERTLSEIWKKLLNVDLIHPSDDFFSLGGNSLLAIKLASQLATNWEIDIDYTDIIELTTIQQQARFIESYFAASES